MAHYGTEVRLWSCCSIIAESVGYVELIVSKARDNDDWTFFGWAAKAYGLEACLAKLNYMKESQKRHNITNPKGFFRFALEKDYRLPAFIAAKIKADAAARKEKERCQREAKEWDKKVANFKYEPATASVQKILNMLS